MEAESKGRESRQPGQDLEIRQQVEQVVVHAGHLVAHDEGLASGSDTAGSEMLQGPRQSLHTVLACLVIGVDEGDVFAVDNLYASLTTCTRAASCVAFPHSPRGPRCHRMALD